ncbi:helix-turn-helix transcriptional regulator [Paenibacillus sp. EKM202P]|nr:helix-turn-helix transcriptional regulator [Paenibacillus sp. EKM202P]KAF6563222.1 helix-turn-helix transcriptional regulator [Paenibacillus sp. EKM207P]
MADKIGVTKKTVHRYEGAEIRISIEKLIQVASILNTTVEELTSRILKYDDTK